MVRFGGIQAKWQCLLGRSKQGSPSVELGSLFCAADTLLADNAIFRIVGRYCSDEHWPAEAGECDREWAVVVLAETVGQAS